MGAIFAIPKTKINMQNRKLLFPKGNNLGYAYRHADLRQGRGTGLLAAAADKMGQARSVVTRQIAYLEQKYGVRLLAPPASSA